MWLWLWRDGHVDLPAWPQHWEPLAFVSHAMSAAELMRFLAGARPDTEHRWGMHLPSWPSSLDRIAMEVYLRDPWEGAPDALPAWAKRGLAWVRARAGDLAWRPSELVDRWLAAAHLDGALGTEAHAFSEGAVIGLRTVERGERSSEWWPFITSLTTVERWPRAILDEALRTRARRSRRALVARGRGRRGSPRSTTSPSSSTTSPPSPTPSATSATRSSSDAPTRPTPSPTPCSPRAPTAGRAARPSLARSSAWPRAALARRTRSSTR
ncbi:MAG: hypothetical protein R3A52_12930 [Polyangiales bacterium]